MKLKKIIIALSIVAITVVLSGCSDTMDLSLNIKSGDKFMFHQQMNQDIILTINNQQVKTNQDIQVNLAMSVKEVDKDKNITIDYKYDSIKMSSESNGEKIQYDSSLLDASNPLTSIYGAVLGKSFTVKLSNKGQVLEVKGISEITNSMLDKVSGSETEKQATKIALSQSFGDDAIKSMMQQSMNIYPKKAVKTGDTWENNYDIKIIFPISVSNKWKLISYKDGVINVDQNSNMVTDTKGQSIDIMGVKANVKLNGDIKGNIKINKDSGLLQSGDMSETMSGEMEILASGIIPENMKVPMKINAKIIYSTTKK